MSTEEGKKSIGRNIPRYIFRVSYYELVGLDEWQNIHTIEFDYHQYEDIREILQQQFSGDQQLVNKFFNIIYHDQDIGKFSLSSSGDNSENPTSLFFFNVKNNFFYYLVELPYLLHQRKAFEDRLKTKRPRRESIPNSEYTNLVKLLNKNRRKISRLEAQKVRALNLLTRGYPNQPRDIKEEHKYGYTLYSLSSEDNNHIAEKKIFIISDEMKHLYNRRFENRPQGSPDSLVPTPPRRRAASAPSTGFGRRLFSDEDDDMVPVPEVLRRGRARRRGSSGRGSRGGRKRRRTKRRRKRKKRKSLFKKKRTKRRKRNKLKNKK
jgi:hypothetical protein